MPKSGLTTAQRGYGARWQRESKRYLQANPLCRMCAERGIVKLAQVVDHIKPHRLGQAIQSGDELRIAEARRLFWDRGNWQPLCAADHDRHKSRYERSGRVAGCDVNGLPADPRSHWRA